MEVIPSIQEVTRHIRHIQLVDHNGIPDDSIRMLKLLPAVQDHRGSLTSLVRDEAHRDVETKLTEVVEDDNNKKAVFTISPYKMLRTTPI